MIVSLALSLLVGFGSAAPGTASQAGAPEASTPAAAKVQSAKSRIRCKSYRPTGTRFDKRDCQTIEEWERRREEAREAIKEIQGKPQICVGDCSGG